MKAKRNLESLIFLRFVAVIAVCFCHLGGALSGSNFGEKIFKFFHDYGKYGVEVFFVISGFVIPFSLIAGKYEIVDYPKFLYKRILRLHPPYLLSLIFTLILSYLVAHQKGDIFTENIASISKSLIYLHAPAENPVYWSLKVEAQYYLLIGFLFPLLKKNLNRSLFISSVAICILSQLTYLSARIGLFNYLPIFLMGIITFAIYQKLVNRKIYLFILLVLTIFCFFSYGKVASVIAGLTAAFILFIDPKKATITHFFGTISYSIYLIHFPLGIKFINFMKPKIPEELHWILFFIALAICLFASWLFFRIIEVASEKWSKQIKYGGTKKVEEQNVANIKINSPSSG